MHNPSVQQALVGGEGRVVQPPVLQRVGWSLCVPLPNRGVDGYLHPVALGLVVTEARGGGFPWDGDGLGLGESVEEVETMLVVWDRWRDRWQKES